MPEELVDFDKLTEVKLKAFYDEQLLPLAEKYRNAITLGPDDSVQSYYIDRFDDGNYIHEIDAAAIQQELRLLWNPDPKSPELADLAAELIELAELLQEKEATSDEISPFIYAMF